MDRFTYRIREKTDPLDDDVSVERVDNEYNEVEWVADFANEHYANIFILTFGLIKDLKEYIRENGL